MKRGQKIAIGCVVVLGVGAGVGLYLVSGAYEKAVAESKRLGLPLHVSELLTSRPAPAENAAAEYRSAILARTALSGEDRSIAESFDLWKTKEEIKTDFVLKSIPKLDAARVDAALRQWRPVFAQIEKALQKPSLDWNRPWEKAYLVLLSEYADLKGMGKAMALDAEWSIERGDLAAGVKRFDQMIRMANQTGQDPILIAKLVEIALIQIALRRVGNVIYRHRSDPKVVSAMREFLRTVKLPDLQPAIRGEVYFFSRTTEMVGQNPRELVGGLGSGGDAALYSLQFPAVRQAVMTRFLTLMNRAHRSMKENPGDWETAEKALAAFDKSISVGNSLTTKILEFLCPQFEPSASAVGGVETVRRESLMLTYLCDEWRTTGKWPDSLPDKGEDSIDPYSHKAFRYRKTPGGFVLHSVGHDRVDDGGVLGKGTKDRCLGIQGDGRLGR